MANKPIRERPLALLLLVLSLLGQPAIAEPSFDWAALIKQTRGISVLDTVKRVNQRVNRLQKISDPVNWQQDDYWATPRELFTRGGGDCEDFAIAKFYLLRAQGIPDTRLRLMFAKTLNQASLRIESHLVLLYQAPGETRPRVLDNLRQDILDLSARQDLIPTAALNQNQYWIYTDHGWDKAQPASEIRRWSALQRRWALQQTQGQIASTTAP